MLSLAFDPCDKEVDLSRIRATPAANLEHLAFNGQGATPPSPSPMSVFLVLLMIRSDHWLGRPRLATADGAGLNDDLKALSMSVTNPSSQPSDAK